MLYAVTMMLLTGVLWTLVGVLFGAAPSDRDRLYTFFIISASAFMAFVWVTQPPVAAPAGEVLRLSALMVPSALMESLAFFLLKLAMERGSQGIAWSIAQSAMVVSFICSIVFLGNPSSAAQWLGMVLVLGGLVLFGRDKPAGSAGANDAAYFRFVFGSFALIGVGQFLRLIPGYMGLSPEALTWRLPVQTIVGVLFWVAICAPKRIWRPAGVWRAALPYAVVVALGQICFYKATDAADKILLTSIVMPVSIGACILLFALWCRFVRHERMSPGGWIAVALDLVGIALLSCRQAT